MTEAGKALYVRAESLLTMTDITKREVIKVSQATTIHLGVTPSTVNMMAKYLVKYTSHHPDIRFVIHDGSTFTLKDELENGILDVTTLRTPIALNGFCSKLLRQEQLMAMVPQGQEEEGLRELTLEELAGMLEETGFPFAYDHFAEGESPDPPFICYLLPGSDNFAADGRVYFRISEVRIELYTDRKDPGAEALVETVLDDAGIFYNKSEVWIQSEKLYEVLYSMER